MRGDVHVRFSESAGVRFPRATHLVIGFQYKDDAERLHAELRERLKKFNLELSEEKTRLIEFGRFAEPNRAQRGAEKPETFSFLGFVHICGQTRAGKFCVRRKTLALCAADKKMDVRLNYRTDEKRFSFDTQDLVTKGEVIL